MSGTAPTRQSRWLRFVILFLFWVGGRSVLNVILFLTDRRHVEAVERLFDVPRRHAR